MAKKLCVFYFKTMGIYNFISVEANVTDENGGNVYAVVFTEAVYTGLLKDCFPSNLGYITPMVPQLNTGELVTTVTCNVDYAFANIEALQSNVSTSVTIGESYYLYMYAVDTHDNSTIYEYPTVITVTTESTTVSLTDDFLLNTGFQSGYEMRSSSVIQSPNVTSVFDGQEYFGYLTHNDHNIHANITVEPGEFAVDDMYAFAVTSDVSANVESAVARKAEFTKHTFTPPVFANSKMSTMTIDNVFTTSDLNSLSNTSDMLEQDVKLYSLVHAQGTNGYKLFGISDPFSLGSSPIINNVVANVITVSH